MWRAKTRLIIGLEILMASNYEIMKQAYNKIRFMTKFWSY